MSSANHDVKAESDAPQTLLVQGGPILVLDGRTPPQEAIVLRNGRVAAVGTAEAMRIVAGPGAEHLDVRGCTVMPGLVDTHPHLLHFGIISYPLVDLADAKNHGDIVERIRKKAAEKEPGKWIFATPWASHTISCADPIVIWRKGHCPIGTCWTGPPRLTP